MINLPLVMGITHINGFMYEVRFSDSSKKRLNFSNITKTSDKDIVEDSGRKSDFGKKVVFKTNSGESVELTSSFLYDI